MSVQLHHALADHRLHSAQFICRPSEHSSWIVHASYGALSRWQLVGRDLHATLDVAAVPDTHWAATGFRVRPDAATLEVTMRLSDHDDHESFDAAVALTQAAA